MLLRVRLRDLRSGRRTQQALRLGLCLYFCWNPDSTGYLRSETVSNVQDSISGPLQAQSRRS